jgi:glyoxylase-like metal-dependent hydrolase (beta-lactamase superfamily II)
MMIGRVPVLLALMLVATVGVALATDPTRDWLGYPPTDVEMELIQVSEHAYYVQGVAGVPSANQGFVSNAGVVITDDGVVVFDALGTPSLAVKLLQRIREITEQPVKRVIVSHYHADHVYGLQVFQDLGAEVVAAAGSELYIDSGAGDQRLQERKVSLAPWINERTRVVRPDVYVERSERFSLGGVDFELTALGAAHSDADLAMYVATDRVLFSGDIIFEGRVPFVGDANSRHWLQTLERLDTGHLEALVPGHGPAASDPNQAIRLTRRYLAYLRETMGAAVDELVPFDEAYASTDWSEFEGLPAFDAAHRRNAYQVYLALEAEALGP